jgi:primosomal protein N' (replication factor Y)
MIADVVFDAPVAHPFRYRVPPDVVVCPGQRVRAPLGRQARVGLAVAVREGEDPALKPLLGVAETGPVLSPAQLALTRWIAQESLSSWGSAAAALLPPLAPGEESPAVPPPETAGQGERPRLFSGADRERRLLARLVEEGEERGLLLLAPGIEDAAAWAGRLAASLGRPVARLDSGAPERARREAWTALARGACRVAVGTRGALLAPVPAPATLALLEEGDPAHKPPGPPRIHSREVVLERARREGSRLYLTGGPPSVETWWRRESGEVAHEESPPAPWPPVSVVDVRGALRAHPLSPPLRRAMRETLAAGGRVLLLVTRIGSAMACGECGTALRCAECGIAMAYSRARRQVTCRLCRRSEPAPETCPACRGRQLQPLGWGTERVEQAVRAAFPGQRVARQDAESPGGGRGTAGAPAARLLVGTRGALKTFRPAGPSLVGFVTPDPVLRLADFRAAERAFALLWAAAERVGDGGRVIVQTQHPGHYAVRAAAHGEPAAFYKAELAFRAELGYPPFRRLCLLTVAGRGGAGPLARELERELRALGELTVYPAAPLGRSLQAPRWQVVVKGGQDLPMRLAPLLASPGARRPRGRAIIEAEMDPIDLA